MGQPPFDELFEAARQALETRRLEVVARTDRVRALLDEYLAAVEKDLASTFAARNGLAKPTPATTPAAARALLNAVKDLPEGAAVPAAERAPAPPPAKTSKTSTAAKGAPPTPQTPHVNDAIESIERGPFPRLCAAGRKRSIVLLGGKASREKLSRLEQNLGVRMDWIETQAPGSRAIQSLEGRILDGHVAAVVLFDGLIKHQHFEPIVAAARQTGTPIGYGGTAGKASLAKAFGEIEGMLKR
jgi:hypothetical protein